MNPGKIVVPAGWHGLLVQRQLLNYLLYQSLDHGNHGSALFSSHVPAIFVQYEEIKTLISGELFVLGM
jgi:hypothetical protein